MGAQHLACSTVSSYPQGSTWVWKFGRVEQWHHEDSCRALGPEQWIGHLILAHKAGQHWASEHNAGVGHGEGVAPGPTVGKGGLGPSSPILEHGGTRLLWLNYRVLGLEQVVSEPWCPIPACEMEGGNAWPQDPFLVCEAQSIAWTNPMPLIWLMGTKGWVPLF